MTRVPTWTELRLDATKLLQIQEQCYQSVHYLLDEALPQLDSKLSRLSQSTTRRKPVVRFENSGDQPNLDSTYGRYENNYRYSSLIRNRLDEKIELNNNLSSTPSKPRKSQSSYELSSKLNSQPKAQISHSKDHTFMSLREIPPKSEDDNDSVDQQDSELDFDVNNIYSLIEKSQVTYDSRNLTLGIERSQSDHDDVSQVTFIEKRKSPPQTTIKKRQVPTPKQNDIPLDQLEHLKPLPMPLCQYFRMNRPNLVDRAEKRVRYLKQSAEKRKSVTTSKIMSALEHVKLTSKGNQKNKYNNLNGYGNGIAMPPPGNDYSAHECNVKYKITEKEMKRLTARTYKRLPEVKKRKKEEISNHLKAQNYKNRLEYGRKLLENRRHGIINYPLKSEFSDDRSVTSSQYDDRSLTTISSQEDSQLNGCARAADVYF